MQNLHVSMALLICLLTTLPGIVLADVETEYDQVVRKRARKIIAALEIEDETKAERVIDIVAQQYKDLATIHDARDAEYNTAENEEQKAAIYQRTEAQLKTLHEAYLQKLHTELTPAQVDQVKDGMTYNVANVTYTNYLEMLPNLTDEQKAYIRAQLLEAREIAMDAGSADEKHRWFGKYKGRINNYLSAEGYDLKQASRDWGERRKAAAASPNATD